MKKFAIIVLLSLGLVSAAPAAVTAGFDVGYLTDNKDAYWSGRAGWQFTTTSTLSHHVEVELGYAEHSESLFGTEAAALPAPFLFCKTEFVISYANPYIVPIRSVPAAR
jgi:hypothetical protein